MYSMGLEGKSALVTGAGSGIGRASAVALAQAGVNLLIADLNRQGLEETAEAIRDAGGNATIEIADVTDPNAVQAAIDSCVAAYGSLDIAHNNAGLNNAAGEFHEIAPAEIEKLMSVNFWGVIHCMQAEIRQMLKQGQGSIINTGSAAGLVAQAGATPYAISKHAVVGLTRSAGVEYAKRGIRINAVCPAMVETPMVSEFTKPGPMREVFMDAHPIGRFAMPNEIADAVVWLASPRSSYVTGACISVDGGYVAA